MLLKLINGGYCVASPDQFSIKLPLKPVFENRGSELYEQWFNKVNINRKLFAKNILSISIRSPNC